jgi:hypothetical protein
MNTLTTIWIQLQFEGFHHWKYAPDEVDWLRNRHRHLFHVRVEWQVGHNDRDREFFIEQDRVRNLITTIQSTKPECEQWSCEEWANQILIETKAFRVDVSEDGENGATVCCQ